MPAILLLNWLPEGFLWYWILLFSIATGLAIGSFSNACIDRLPLQSLSEAHKKQLQSDPAKSGIFEKYILTGQISIAFPPRSICFACGRQLEWIENIPLISYIWGRGRCRHCRFEYGSRSFWIELLNGMVYGFLFGISGISLLGFSLAITASTGLIYVGILKEQGRIPPLINRAMWITAILSIFMILARLLLHL